MMELQTYHYIAFMCLLCLFLGGLIFSALNRLMKGETLSSVMLSFPGNSYYKAPKNVTPSISSSDIKIFYLIKSMVIDLISQHANIAAVGDVKVVESYELLKRLLVTITNLDVDEVWSEGIHSSLSKDAGADARQVLRNGYLSIVAGYSNDAAVQKVYMSLLNAKLDIVNLTENYAKSGDE